MTVNRTASACVIAAVFLIGCSDSDDDDEIDADTSESEQTSMPAPGADPLETSETASRFNGDYLISCSPSEDDDEVFETTELTVQDDLYSAILTQYGDALCTQSEIVLGIEASADFPGGTADTQLGVADFVDFTIESATVNGELSPVDADEVMDFDLILLTGNNLYFGLNTDELDGETSDTRPVDIDINTVFVLQ